MLEYWLPRILVTIATVVLMEPAVSLIHRHIMHGFGWGWHRDHHEPDHKHMERNDLYALVGAAISIALFALAGGPEPYLFWVALGTTVYGILYFFVHDGLVHRRWPFRVTPKNAYLRRLVEAHHLHHAVRGKEGAVSFGFLYAPRVDKLRAELHRNSRAASDRARRDQPAA